MTIPEDAAGAVRERYARFARDEAPGRSELYRAWAQGVATDGSVQQLLARIPPERRQPPLVFAVTRLLGAPETDYPSWASWLAQHADAVVTECGRRSVQTNEPLRCAALLPALALVPGPIALLEVGASAGLCLYPDRYSYRYRRPDGEVIALDPPDGPSAVTLESDLRGEAVPPLRLPEVVWRAGIDLAPLDPALPDTEAWLTGLVWPGETGRAERVRQALRIAASDPPLLVAGDGAALIAEVARQAPADATLVVTTPGVLAFVPWAGRRAMIDAARAAGRWITLDAPTLHDGWTQPVDPQTWPGGFALALDGEVLAAVDPLGSYVEWRAEDAARPR
ncbi:DUF2332 domain-containing protein [Microbacterium sp. zg.Y1090]|uniref:DUF2332 domain-containing protein n=1 Tax=Microbacterium TaxID=33882 RepID=UPI00214BDE35|nr:MULTISPECIES: DUF2332 domain-containing protein [unclassified Microbacterium]MCR2812853.1 DUF2332 domain-containing protein [Microbacterium sp. zg.Y1084]MCR2817344.1 DUF2332 domain-containing protein [Microbacterium sp. zg.Y1090]MDL5485996.1 DUF2332 domain-containing protein [Microbacterium sp. zg-Y1211]WIM29168.1 DUF2332 domain-containing protein [Microbacterium sp. zg-Y1090]